MARHALAPCCCSRTSSVRLGHISRDDKGKVGCTDKLPSHRYKTPVPAIGRPKENTSAEHPTTPRSKPRSRTRTPRLDEVKRDFVRSKEEVGETTKGGSPFAPEILDKLIPSSF
ncbi:hypothetical protein BHM03_00062430 [Ensete ventricosum]|nr:hypothetical protein BHM03_00062430 [Ensete ventricosum]